MDIKNDIHIMEMNDNLYQRLKQSELVIHAKVESMLDKSKDFFLPLPFKAIFLTKTTDNT